jgi:hypothetical protein
MATLSREKKTKDTIVSVDPVEVEDGKVLNATIPSPFPQEERERLLREAANQSLSTSDEDCALKSAESSVTGENQRAAEHVSDFRVMRWVWP